MRLRERERRQLFLLDYPELYRTTTEYGDLILQQRLQMVHWIIEVSFLQLIVVANKSIARMRRFCDSLLFFLVNTHTFEEVDSFLHFSSGSNVQRIIHQIKYKNGFATAARHIPNYQPTSQHCYQYNQYCSIVQLFNCSIVPPTHSQSYSFKLESHIDHNALVDWMKLQLPTRSVNGYLS